MTPKHPSCRAIESDLVATATGEAGAAAAQASGEGSPGPWAGGW